MININNIRYATIENGGNEYNIIAMKRSCGFAIEGTT
jgi:hypothetical protein